jgi:hypothetical protein
MRSAILVMTMVVAACNSSDGTDGEVGGHCYPNGTCNATLACSAGVCVPFGALPDSGFVIPDAAVCSQLYEPNDTIATAHPLIGTSQDLTGLAICPSTDKDTFQITLAQQASIEAITTVSSGAPVAVSILNSGGSTLATGTPVSAGSLGAMVSNVPAGNYYVQTSSTTVQTYSLMTQAI